MELLERIFSKEDALLAGELSEEWEKPDAISRRAGLSNEEAWFQAFWASTDRSICM